MRLLLSALAFFIIAGLLGGLVHFFIYDLLNLPDGVAKYAGPILFFSCLIGIVVFLFNRMSTRYLRQMSEKELRDVIFVYYNEYFDFIGHENETVKKFKDLISREDLDTLYDEWDSIQKEFKNLEVNAGHTGRPLIMDYYLNLKYAMRLLKRKTA